MSPGLSFLLTLSGSLLVTDVSTNPFAPDRASVTFTVAAIGISLCFGGHRTDGVTLHVTLGAVRSMLMPLTDTWAMLPATSAAVPVTDCPEPSEVIVTGA